MRPVPQSDVRPSSPNAQLEITKAIIQATADITSSMVQVTNEKNPAKISEAYRVLYKAILDAVKSSGPAPAPKPPSP